MKLRRHVWIVFSILWEGCIATPPLALHQLVEVEEGGEVVLSLSGLDLDGDAVRCFVFVWCQCHPSPIHPAEL